MKFKILYKKIFINSERMVNMGDIRSKVLRTKVLKEMDSNAIISDVKCDISYEIKWKGEYSYGGGTAGGPIYNKDSGKKEINYSTAKDLKDQDDISNWIESHKKRIYRYRNTVGKIYYKVYLYFKILYSDNEYKWYYNSFVIDHNNYYIPIINNKNKSRIHIEMTNDKAEISLDKYKSKLQITDNIPEQNNDSEFMIEYLKSSDAWVDAEFGEIEEYPDENIIYLPLYINDKNIKFSFKEPHDSNCDIWELSELFNYNDPWNLQDEPVQIIPQSVSENNSFNKEFWNIRKPKSNKNISKSNNLKMYLCKNYNKIYNYLR